VTLKAPAIAACALTAVVVIGAHDPLQGQDGSQFLTWTAAEAQKIGRSFRVDGRVGSAFDFRITNTDRSYNYKLRATWLTDDVIRATARLTQLSERMTNAQTEALVRDAQRPHEAVILIEIDPREGSGVIPLEWITLFGPSGLREGDAAGVRGRNLPALRNVRALAGAFRRDYNYDVFWIVFPLRTESGEAVLPPGTTEAELVVRIYNKEGRVRWPVPSSMKTGD
jgi:hypothetical protein